MGKTSIFIAVFLFAATGLTTQVTQEWVARYNGPSNGDDSATAIAVDRHGNVYVTGWSLGSGTAEDYATIKYNPAGIQEWAARYNGPGNNTDKARSVAVDESGNVYVTGYSWGSNTTNFDYATIKYNSSGIQEWVARYNGPGNGTDAARSIAVDGQGNVFVTGSCQNAGYDYATVKYNANGVQQWVADYNGSGNEDDIAEGMAIDRSGNVYVTGWSLGSGTGEDYATVMYNSAGTEKWVARYNGSGDGWDVPTAIAVDASGNVYVTGYSMAMDIGGWDYATIKYNEVGVQKWVARYNNPGNGADYAHSLAIDGSGNVYVTGSSENSDYKTDYATVKYNSDGIQQWVARYYQPSISNAAYAIAVDDSGNVYVTGETGYEYGLVSVDYATVKYNSAGVQEWVASYNGPGNQVDWANSLAIDRWGNCYVTGYSYGSTTGYDYATIKYRQTGPMPDSLALETPRPNPASDWTEIIYSLPVKTPGFLKIYDVTGKLVRYFNLTNNQSSVFSVIWDGRDSTGKPVPSGLYFIRLATAHNLATTKLVLTR